MLLTVCQVPDYLLRHFVSLVFCFPLWEEPVQNFHKWERDFPVSHIPQHPKCPLMLFLGEKETSGAVWEGGTEKITPHHFELIKGSNHFELIFEISFHQGMYVCVDFTSLFEITFHKCLVKWTLQSYIIPWNCACVLGLVKKYIFLWRFGLSKICTFSF